MQIDFVPYNIYTRANSLQRHDRNWHYCHKTKEHKHSIHKLVSNIYRHQKISYAIRIFAIADITLYKTGKALAHDAFHHVPTPDFLMCLPGIKWVDCNLFWTTTYYKNKYCLIKQKSTARNLYLMIKTHIFAKQYHNKQNSEQKWKEKDFIIHHKTGSCHYPPPFRHLCVKYTYGWHLPFQSQASPHTAWRAHPIS